MADGRDQQAGYPVTPRQEFTETGKYRSKQSAERLDHMPCRRTQACTALGLKADIQLAKIVQRCEYAQASPPNFADVLTGEADQTPSPDRQAQQRFDYSSHVCRVIKEGVPFAH